MLYSFSADRKTDFGISVIVTGNKALLIAVMPNADPAANESRETRDVPTVYPHRLASALGLPDLDKLYQPQSTTFHSR